MAFSGHLFALIALLSLSIAWSYPSLTSSGPSPWPRSTRSLVTPSRPCSGSTNLEHLTGECLYHFECVQRRGLSIGPCQRSRGSHGSGSCCLLKSASSTVRRTMPTTTVFDQTATHSFLNSITSPLKSTPAKVRTTTSDPMLTPDESTFFEILSANNRQTTTTGKALRTRSKRPRTSRLPQSLTSTSSRPNSTQKSEKMTEAGSSGIWTHYDPSTSATWWNQQLPSFPAISSNPPSIPNIHVEDIFSNHFPVMPSFPSSTVSPPVISQFPTIHRPSIHPVLPSLPVPSSTARPAPAPSSPQDISHQGRPTCGIRPLRPTGRIVGGRNAGFGEWPWQVLIKEAGWLGLFLKPKCGGVLIDDRWVLTAAHCQPGTMGSLIVSLGQHEMNGEAQQLKPVMKTVRRMIVHRDYNPETFDNDIALIELDTPFEMKNHIVPICLPESDYSLVGEYAHIAGFGKLSYGGSMPNVMQTVQLPIIENSQCQSMFANAGHYKYIRDSFICAGYPQGGKDSCEGDSGGPMMIEKNGVWTLVGTVSHGIKCAEANMPGVYMKTYSYLGWIRGIIGRKY